MHRFSTYLVEQRAEKEVFRTRFGARNVINVLRSEPAGEVQTYVKGDIKYKSGIKQTFERM